MGKLSALVNMTLKFLSRYPITKKNVMMPIAATNPALLHNKYNFSLRFILSNQSVGGKSIGVTTVKIEKLIVGADKKSTVFLKESSIIFLLQGS